MKKGFSLIELIVVISILAVLAVVLVPKIVGYKQIAKRSNYRTSAKIIIKAIQTYNSDNVIDPIKITEKFGDKLSNESLKKLIVNQTEVAGKDVNKFKDFSIGQIKSISNGDFMVINDEIKDVNGTDNIPSIAID